MWQDISVNAIENARMRMTKAEIQAEQEVYSIVSAAIEENGVEIKDNQDIRTWNSHLFSRVDYMIPNTNFYFTHLMDTSRVVSGRVERPFSFNFDPRLRRLIQVKNTSNNSLLFNIINGERIQKLLDIAVAHQIAR
ncbi:MAG: hypothetical protein J5742_04540 [Alphaproteobacteria bacterium]|nr:hypothetical protein [Alphaproteobacteria bacterium]